MRKRSSEGDLGLQKERKKERRGGKMNQKSCVGWGGDGVKKTKGQTGKHSFVAHFGESAEIQMNHH